MFKPVRMKSVTVRLLREEAGEGALALAETKAFQPDRPEDPKELMPEASGERYELLYRNARAHMDKLVDICGCSVSPRAPRAPRVVSESELADVERWLREAWGACSEEQEKLRQIDDERRRITQLLRSLKTFRTLDIDLATLARGTRLLDLQLGTLPASNVVSVRRAISHARYIMRTFNSAPPLTHAIIAGPRGREREIAAVLQTAGWRALRVPHELYDYPERAQAKLLEQQRELAVRSHELARAIEERRRARSSRVAESREVLAHAAPYSELAPFLRARGALVSVTGWVPATEGDELRKRLSARLGARFVMSTREPMPEERRTVPSLVTHRAWLMPFTSLVDKYGVPRYGEVDPTIPFALSFVAMFGMMFGDVGQGIVMAALGAALHRWIGRFTPFVVAAGVASALFGVLYGSVFGLDTVIAPVWLSPLRDPIRMVIVALCWGIGFVFLTSAIAIYNHLAEREFGEALFGDRGVAGVVLYLAAADVAYRYLTRRDVGGLGLAAIAIPLATVSIHEWRGQSGTIAERAVVVAIESVEIVLNYAANTLSFLRLAAFSLNHVALALAILSIARMMGPAGHWATIVIGNVVVLVLEGVIVGIQALRLEYYEGFARFFQGDGRPFRALGIRLAWTST